LEFQFFSTELNQLTKFLTFYNPAIYQTCSKIQQDKQSTYSVTLRHFRETIVSVEKQKALHILMCACSFKVSRMQYACAILSPVSCLAVQYFSTLS